MEDNQRKVLGYKCCQHELRLSSQSQRPLTCCSPGWWHHWPHPGPKMFPLWLPETSPPTYQQRRPGNQSVFLSVTYKKLRNRNRKLTWGVLIQNIRHSHTCFPPRPLSCLCSVSTSLIWTSLRSTGCVVSSSHHVTARVTRTWSWTYARLANIKSLVRSAETIRLVDAPPPTAAGTATAKSWTTQPSMSGTTTVWESLCVVASFKSCCWLFLLLAPQSTLPVDQTVCTRDRRTNSVWGSHRPLCSVDPGPLYSLSHTGVILFQFGWLSGFMGALNHRLTVTGFWFPLQYN